MCPPVLQLMIYICFLQSESLCVGVMNTQVKPFCCLDLIVQLQWTRVLWSTTYVRICSNSECQNRHLSITAPFWHKFKNIILDFYCWKLRRIKNVSPPATCICLLSVVKLNFQQERARSATSDGTTWLGFMKPPQLRSWCVALIKRIMGGGYVSWKVGICIKMTACQMFYMWERLHSIMHIYIRLSLVRTYCRCVCILSFRNTMKCTHILHHPNKIFVYKLVTSHYNVYITQIRRLNLWDIWAVKNIFFELHCRTFARS